MSRPLTDEERKGIVKGLTGGWGNIFSDAVDVFDRANFVQSNEERSPLASAVRSLTRFNCRRWARADKANFPVSVNQANANICTPYLQDIGEFPGEGSLDEEIETGQCQTSYRFRWSLSGVEQPPIFSGFYDGPMAPVVRVPGFVALWNSSNRTGFNFNVGTQNNSQPGEFLGWERVDGLPDDCGNRDILISPPPPLVGGPTLNSNVTINLPGVGAVTAGLTLNPDGSFEVCIEELDTCFTVNPGDIFGGENQAGDTGAAPGDVGAPGEEVGTDSDGEAEGEAEENQVLGGLKIAIISFPPFAKPYQNDIYRGVCYVYMGTPDGLDLHPDGATLTSGQFVLPKKENLTKWKVIANSGYNLSVTPFYLEVNA